MSTKLWGFSCFLIRNMFGSLVVYLTQLTLHVHFQYFGQALHLATSCTHLSYACHALIYILFLHPIMSHLPYALNDFVLSFVWTSFLIHLAPLMHHYQYSIRTFMSCPQFSLTLCLFVTKRGRVYSREYTKKFFHFYMTLVHILRGRNSISCAHL